MKILEEVVTCDGILSVVSRDNMLALRNGDTGYSCIYTDNEAFQPVFIPVQKAIEAYSYSHVIQNAVILGGGCCTIPRFIIKRFNNSILIDSVEYLPAIIELTRKYFLDGIDTEKLNLINEDAFVFIHDTPKKYDLFFVDLYVGDVKSAKSDTIDFLADLANHATEQAIIIFNGYHSSLEQCKMLCKHGLTYFNRSFLMQDESNTYYIILCNRDFDERTLKQYLLPA